MNVYHITKDLSMEKACREAASVYAPVGRLAEESVTVTA
jgi:hypothetical protein